MSTHRPNRWVLIEYPTGQKCILAGWSGGYLDGDAWRRSTPVVEALLAADESTRVLVTQSGSRYEVHEDSYGLSTLTAMIAQQIATAGVRVMKEEKATDFLESVTTIRYDP